MTEYRVRPVYQGQQQFLTHYEIWARTEGLAAEGPVMSKRGTVRKWWTNEGAEKACKKLNSAKP